MPVIKRDHKERRQVRHQQDLLPYGVWGGVKKVKEDCVFWNVWDFLTPLQPHNWGGWHSHWTSSVSSFSRTRRCQVAPKGSVLPRGCSAQSNPPLAVGTVRQLQTASNEGWRKPGKLRRGTGLGTSSDAGSGHSSVVPSSNKGDVREALLCSPSPRFHALFQPYPRWCRGDQNHVQYSWDAPGIRNGITILLVRFWFLS